MPWLIRTGCSLVLVLCLAPRASASPSYPKLMRRTLDLECAPSCLLCHTVEQGGFATSNTPFGINLRRMFSAQCCDDPALVRILGELEAADTDSDQDGTPDLEELRAATDPNDADAAAELVCQARDQGCGVTRLPRSAANTVSSTLAIGLLTLFSMRRHKRRTP